MARYAAQGVRVVCVVATRGEVGEIVSPELDTPQNLARLGEIREDELRRALAQLGSIESRILGYRDSGMMGTPDNDDPRSFWRADLDEAAGRLVAIVREVRPDVIIGPNAYGGDGHPDDIRAGEVARMAYERAGDPAAYPAQLAAGSAPWTPAKLYEPVDQFGRREKLVRALRARGIAGAASMVARVARHWRPARERDRRRSSAAQNPVTTRIDVGRFLDAKYSAMAEHRSQIAPDSDRFAISAAERRAVSPLETYSLRRARIPIELPETDLFAGVLVEG